MEIQLFNSPQFGQVRAAGTAEDPVFCAADICRALGYTNGRKAVLDHCDEGDVTKRDTPTSSGTQSMTFVNESGLYALIFGSKMESAKQFKKWVTSEVLPTIRKTGAYATTEVMERAMNDPDYAIRVFQQIKDLRQQNQMLDSGTNPEGVRRLTALVDDLCLGYKLPGAGGGGYLYMVAKDPDAAARIRVILEENRQNKYERFVDMTLSKTGMQVSRS